MLANDDALPEGVTVVDYGIRGMHLAYDLLDGCDALVMVDALPGRSAPGEVVTLAIGPDDVRPGEIDAHGMDPVAVLGSLHSLGGELPLTFVVGCAPVNLDEGIGLTDVVEAAVPVAIDAVHAVIGQIASSQIVRS